MGKIILCRGKKADTPLTVLQTGVKLYTAEELCYYIYNNIYLIGQDFIDDNLISFLDETGEKELAERVRKLKETGGSLAQIFVIILKTIDYYSVAEIEQLKEILNTLGKQSVCERLKARGDGYLNAGYYFAAVRCYESIIKDYKGKDLLAADYAKVYHNMGTAYARMFMYDKAVIYYDEAYRTGQHEESKKCSIAALIMAKKDKEPVRIRKAYAHRYSCCFPFPEWNFTYINNFIIIFILRCYYFKCNASHILKYTFHSPSGSIPVTSRSYQPESHWLFI
jgi:tetratricopeptide (TPR) repeat protein